MSQPDRRVAPGWDCAARHVGFPHPAGKSSRRSYASAALKRNQFIVVLKISCSPLRMRDSGDFFTARFVLPLAVKDLLFDWLWTLSYSVYFHSPHSLTLQLLARSSMDNKMYGNKLLFPWPWALYWLRHHIPDKRLEDGWIDYDQCWTKLSFIETR